MKIFGLSERKAPNFAARLNMRDVINPCINMMNAKEILELSFTVL